MPTIAEVAFILSSTADETDRTRDLLSRQGSGDTLRLLIVVARW